MAGPDTSVVGKTCPWQGFSVRWNKNERQLEFLERARVRHTVPASCTVS
jgi:hypothetical protein